MSYDALLLDYDGVVVTILDAEQRLPAFREAVAGRFRQAGVETTDDLVEQFVHSVSYEQLQTASQRTGVDPARLWRSRDDALADVLTRAAREGRKRPYDDVEALSEVEVPLGVASNNQQRVVEAIAAEYDLADQFDTVRARAPVPESLQRKKPNPLYVERTLADVGGADALYVGDRGKDVVAGNRAGLDTVLLRREHNRERTVEADPTYEVEGLEEVVEILQRTAE